jgi:glutathione synthase/RimK-type ligase-like ATP-grasp enzyme
MVIILGADNDYHAHYMLNACRKRAVQSALFDSSSYPQRNKIGWCPKSTSGSLELSTQTVAFEQIQSVFWSSLSSCKTAESLDSDQTKIALNDSLSVLRTFLEEPSINWVNSWHAFQFHKVKPRQLSLAVACGAQIPETYIGNQSQAIIHLVNRCAKAIYKPVYGGAFCALVTPDLLDKIHLERVLALAPVTVQQYITGTNIRTYVIGEDVYSAEIGSSSIDFRDDEYSKISSIKTPESINTLARTIAVRFGMYWTAIDWRRSDQGEYYFLEANPSPMFIYFEQQTGYPITDKLIDLLTFESTSIAPLELT